MLASAVALSLCAGACARRARWLPFLTAAYALAASLLVSTALSGYFADVGSDVPLYRSVAAEAVSASRISFSVGDGTTNVANLFAALQLSVAIGPVAAASVVAICGGYWYGRVVDDLRRVVLWGRPMTLLLAFLPSGAMFGATFGKESWTRIGVGLVTVAVLERPSTGRLARGATGFLVLGLVRPHFAVALALAVGLATMRKPSRGRAQRRGRSVILGATVLVAGVFLLRTQVEVISKGSGLFERTEELTTSNNAGGSALNLRPVGGPVDVALRIPPVALATLIRPLPVEATSVYALLVSAETMAVAGLVVLGLRRRQSSVIAMSRDRIAYLVLAPALLIAIQAAGVSNLGTLVRVRTTFLPLVVAGVVVCIAGTRSRGAQKKAATRATDPAVR